MSATVTARIERRAGNTTRWIADICSEFSYATAWNLQFVEDTGNADDRFDRRELDWCWHSDVSDGVRRVGALYLDVPGVDRSSLTFDAAYRLAEIIANQITQVLTARRQLQHQASEIGALINKPADDADDFRMRLRALMRASVCLPNYLAAALFVLEPDGQAVRFRMSYHLGESDIPARRRSLSTAPFDLRALRTGDALVTPDVPDGSVWLPDSMATGLCVAVQNDSGPVGTLWLYDRRVRKDKKTQTDLVRGLGTQIADVFERISLLRDSKDRHRLAKELNVVASTTADCCEFSDTLPGCAVAMRSCSRCEVGGDLCEVVRLDKHRTVFIVGDASGDSIPAAIVMTAARGALHALLDGLASGESTVDDVVFRANQSLLRVTAAQQFISLVIGVLDERDSSFTYTNAGHPPPLHLRKGTATTLESQGILMGVLDAAEYKHDRILLQPGDLLVFYTDGITEARNRSQKMFREQGIIDALNHDQNGTAREVLETIWSRHVQHTGGENQDDRTLVVVRALRPEPR